MEKQPHIPSILRRRVFLTLLAGAGSLIITGITSIQTKDHVLLCLGTVIFLSCMGKGILLWHTLSRGRYTTITGICSTVSRLPLHGCQKVHVAQEDGTETILILSRQTPFQPEVPYHFYFRQGAGFTSGAFLGCEAADSRISENAP